MVDGVEFSVYNTYSQRYVFELAQVLLVSVGRSEVLATELELPNAVGLFVLCSAFLVINYVLLLSS